MATLPPDASTDSRSPYVVQESNVPAVETNSPDGAFSRRTKRLAGSTGGRTLGCSLIEVPPGKRACPYHYHVGNEEAMYVLEGAGTLRLGDKSFAIGAGDYVTLPTNPRGAHQVWNTAAAPLRLLMLSTMRHPDITVYPDSNKVGLYGGAAPGAPADAFQLKTYLPSDAGVEYWDGE